MKLTNEQTQTILDGEIPEIKDDGVIGVMVKDIKNIGAHMAEMAAHLCHEGRAGEGGSHRCKYQDEILTLRKEIERLKAETIKLLDAAVCPCCDKSGAYYDNYGEVRQCQWCDEVNKLREQ